MSISILENLCLEVFTIELCMHWLLLKYSKKKLTLTVREITSCVSPITDIGTDYLHPYTHMYTHTHISWIHHPSVMA